MQFSNQQGFVMPVIIIVVALLAIAVLYYLYSSRGGASMQVTPSYENIDVTPKEELGVSYTTE